MGIAKSFKSLFKTRKKKEIEGGSASPKGKPKNPVARNKSMRMGIYEPYRNHFPLRQNPIPIDKSTLSTSQQHNRQPQPTEPYQLPYGAYHPSRGKLVTANGDFVQNTNGNYEYFDPLKRNQNMYASNESIQSNLQSIYQQHQIPMRNSQLRSSTRSLDQFGTQGSIGLVKNSQQRLSMRSTVGSASLTNVNQAANAANQGNYQYQDWQFNQQMPARPSSVDPYQMMGQGSQQNLAQMNPYLTPQQQPQQQMYQQQSDFRALTGLKFDASGVPVTQNPYEIAQAVRKMEQCLQMLNSLQQSSAKTIGHQQQQQQQQQQLVRHTQATPQTLQRSIRKTQILQPQPEFQEREARKKRRLRKKSDLSKFDLSDLRKKLETIDREDSTDSGGDSINDKGYCEGSDASSEGQTTPEKLRPADHSADDSGESSDSGVQTPPPVDGIRKKDFKPILSMTKGILKQSQKKASVKRSNSQ